MYRGEGATITRAPIRSGASAAASTPVIALTEWPTNTASRRSRASHTSTTSRAYPSREEYRSSEKADASERPEPT